jgi:hypothetical protein
MWEDGERASYPNVPRNGDGVVFPSLHSLTANAIVSVHIMPMFSKVRSKDVLKIMCSLLWPNEQVTRWKIQSQNWLRTSLLFNRKGLCFRPSKILGTLHLAF